MRNTPRNFGEGMKKGKFLEGAVLGRPTKFDHELPIEDAFSKGKLVPLVIKNEEFLEAKIRENQSDDPVLPKRPFNRKLVRDIEDNLSKAVDLDADQEIRIYSAVETAYDLVGVDFWVELYDSEQDKVLSKVKVDLKSNPYGEKGRLADLLYYYDEEIASLDDKEAIFREVDYKELVENITQSFKSALNIPAVTENRRKISELQL